MRNSSENRFWAYLVPLLIIAMMAASSLFYAIFLPKQESVLGGFFGIYTSIFNGYTEVSGQFLVAALNALTAMMLVAFSAVCIDKLLHLRKHINFIFLMMLASQFLFVGLVGFNTPGFAGGVSLFDTDCMVVIIAAFLMGIATLLSKSVRTGRRAIDRMGPGFFVFSGVCPAMLVALLSAADNNYAYIYYAPMLVLLSLFYYYLYSWKKLESESTRLLGIWLLIVMLLLSMELYLMYIIVAPHLVGLLLYSGMLVFAYCVYAIYLIRTGKIFGTGKKKTRAKTPRRRIRNA